MKILAFAASHRPDSLNKKLILLAAEKIRSLNVEIDIAEYGDFDMPIYNDTLADKLPEVTKTFSQRCKDVDGIIIAMPEYNWSFPASLKNIIDWTSRIDNNNLAGKTAFLMSATTGARGGIAGLQQFKSPMEALHMIVFHKVFPLSHAQNAFTDGGQLKDKMQQDLFFNIISDYISFTRKLSQT